MAAMLGKPNRQVRVLRGKPMTRQDLIKVAEKAEAGFYVVVAAVNELASMAVFDAMDTLRKNDFHKCREARRWALQCERKLHDYETMMRIQLQDLSRREGSRTADGKDMDLTVKKNRADATIIFTSVMTLLNAVSGDDEEEKDNK